jgi:hypothetical protein
MNNWSVPADPTPVLLYLPSIAYMPVSGCNGYKALTVYYLKWQVFSGNVIHLGSNQYRA